MLNKDYTGHTVYYGALKGVKRLHGIVKELGTKSAGELLLDMPPDEQVPYVVYEDGEWDILAVILDEKRYSISDERTVRENVDVPRLLGSGEDAVQEVGDSETTDD